MPALIGEYGVISVPKLVKPGLTRPRTSQAVVNRTGPAMAPSAIQRAVGWGRIRGGLVLTNVSSVMSVSLLGFGLGPVARATVMTGSLVQLPSRFVTAWFAAIRTGLVVGVSFI